MRVALLVAGLAACAPEAGSTMVGGETPEGPAAQEAGAADRIFAAIKAGDRAAIEALRADLDAALVERLLESWKQRHPWSIKDGFVWLLAHRDEPDIDAIMWDALASPDPRTRAAAVATLRDDPALLARLLPGGEPDVSAIDAAVSAELGAVGGATAPPP